LSGARFFPIGDESGSEAGEEAPEVDGIDACVAEIRRLTGILELIEGFEVPGHDFVAKTKAELKDQEEQLGNLKKDRKKEVPQQVQIDRLNRDLKFLDHKLAKTKERKKAALAVLDAATKAHDTESNSLDNQKAKKAALKKELQALHMEFVFEDISSEEEEGKAPKAPGNKASDTRSPGASQAAPGEAAGGTKDARQSGAGEQPRAKRPCKGDGKGKTSTEEDMSEEEGDTTP
jgi:septal ring factor EnvC (AmiA/AmiB activator)